MSLPAPLSVSLINNNTSQEPGLQAFQRVTAQIVSVSGTTAVLEIDGQPVVARLTSADQAAALVSRPTAQFLVTQLTDQVVTLKFLNDQAPQSNSIINNPELAVRLLEQYNLPVTVGSLMVARSMLKQHLPVTPKLLDELLGALSNYGTWGEADAELAAALKSAGLPVTAHSLALASRQPAQTAEALSHLMASLRQAASRALPGDALVQLNSTLRGLDALIVKTGGENSGLADQLKAAVEALGRSLENLLLEQIQNPAKPIPENSLTSLLKLQQMLERSGNQETAQAIREFLSDLRLNQFMNVKPDPVPGQGEWSEIGFMIQSPHQKMNEEFSSARLRIAHESNGESGRINPAYTRLILQVDLGLGETVEADLSIVGRQVRTSVMAPDPAWCRLAESELPSLAEALNGLGYALQDVQIGAGAPQPFGGIRVPRGKPQLTSVNIEV